MTCGICSQWNPEGAARCCFCGNVPASEVDTTAQGRGTSVVLLDLPPGQGRALLDGDPPGTGGGFELSVKLPPWVVAVGVLVGVVLLLAYRTCGR